MKNWRKFLMIVLTVGLILPISFYLFFSTQVKHVKAVSPLCGITLTGATAAQAGLTKVQEGSRYIFTLTADNFSCPSGDGIIIGAHNITFNGSGKTITGAHTNDTDFYNYGVDDSGGWDNIIIENINLTGFDDGVYFQNVTNSSIISVTATNSIYKGIHLVSSTSNTLDGNTAVSNNSDYSNSGIYLENSTSNVLTDNNMSGNAYNLMVTGSSDSQYNNTINTTNTVEDNRPVYYLYDPTSAHAGETFSGDIGMFWCISCNNITVKDATLADNNDSGVYFRNVTGSTIQNLTISSNTNGIKIFSSSGNTLDSNNLSANVYGIYLDSSSDNSIINNDASSNTDSGIYLTSSGSSGHPNILSGNETDSNTNYGIVLYSSPYNSLSDNNTASNMNGIYLSNSGNSTLSSNNASSNKGDGLYINLSDNNTLSDNITSSNKRGIVLVESSSNSLSDNHMKLNEYGLWLGSSNTNNLNGNEILNNYNDINDNGTNSYSNNQSSHNLVNKMLTFAETARTKTLPSDATVNFDISIFNIKGAVCANCVPSITTSPSEVVASTQNGNRVTGSFSVTKSGTYSLMVSVTDPSTGDSTERKYLYFVNATGSQTTTYYLRGTNATHGQPIGTDAGSLLFTAPTSMEMKQCGAWVQVSPDEIPVHSLAYLTSIDTYSWYKTTGQGTVGLQRFFDDYATSADVDFSSAAIPASADYSWTDKVSLDNLNLGMDYPFSWYWLALKFNSTSDIFWATFPINPPGPSDEPTHADFIYTYTTTPVVQSISNNDINLLSATASAADNSDASIVLEGTGSTNITLGDATHKFSRPFKNYASTINSDGTAVIAANDLSGTTTMQNPVALDIAPTSGSATINIGTWNISGDYSKSWTEVSSGTASVNHKVGSLEANTRYSIKVDGVEIGAPTSDGAGNISFDFMPGTSTKAMTITKSIASVNQSQNQNGNGSEPVITNSNSIASTNIRASASVNSAANTSSQNAALEPVASSVNIGKSSGGSEIALGDDISPKVDSLMPFFSGTTVPGATVYLEINSKTINATVVADAAGKWQYQVTEPLEPGDHTIKVTIKSPDGVLISGATYPFTISASNVAPETNSAKAATSLFSNIWTQIAIGASLVVAIALIGLAVKKRRKK